MSVPKFNIDAPGMYDQGDYSGRFRHFLGLIDPRFLLVGEKEIFDARDLLKKYVDNGRAAPSGVTDEQLWHAKSVLTAATHPQTGETINPLFRMSCFIPTNIPICVGMLLARPTIFNAVLWQWVNQTYNAAFNYANANKSNAADMTNILTAYGSASAVSVGMAVGLGEWVKRSTSLKPFARTIVQGVTPFVAVASAGAFNAVLMRSNELFQGIAVQDHEGTELGSSKLAAQQALGQIALSRVVLPLPILLFPPVILAALKKIPAVTRTPAARICTELAVITGCLWGAFPGAIALFPQQSRIPVEKLEPAFRNLKDSKGMPVTHVQFNKGI